MKHNKLSPRKKGFTIVELVVVIAVVAVLAAVLIPTFANIVKKAKISNDTVLVKNLNTIVTTEKAINSNFATAHDAITAVLENGYGVEKLTPTSDGMLILWDTQAKQFVLAKDGTTMPEIVFPADATPAAKVNYFNICKTMEEAGNSKYSVYMGSDVEINAPLELKVGFDVGANTEKVEFTYTGSDKAIVRTNNGDSTVTVDNAAAEVYWYGVTNTLTVTKAAMNSVHVFGTITGTAEVNDGNLVFESGAKVETLRVNKAAEAEADVQFVVNGGATINSIVFDTVIPAANVTISGTVNAVVIDSTLDQADAVIEKVGAAVKAENIISDKEAVEAAKKFAGGIGTEASPYLIANEEQLKSVNAETETYFKMINDVVVTEVPQRQDHWNNSIKAVVDNLKHSVFDGNGYSIVCEEGTEINSIFNRVDYSTIKNLNFYNTTLVWFVGGSGNFENVNAHGEMEVGNNQGAYLIYTYPYADKIEVSFKNCISYMDIQGAGNGGNYNAVFVGYTVVGSGEVKEFIYNFENCKNEGSLICGKASMFLANDPSPSEVDLTLNIKNCENNGIIQAVYMGNDYPYSQVVSSNSHGQMNKVNLTIGTTTTTYTNAAGDHQLANVAIPGNGTFVHGPNDATLKLVKNEDGAFVITASSNASVAYYEVSVTLYTRLISGGTSVQGVKERVEASAFVDGAATTAKLKYIGFVDKAWVDANPGAVRSVLIEANEETKQEKVVVYTLNGNVYYYMGAEECTLDGAMKMPQIVGVSAYDANGKLLASAGLTNKQ